MNLPHYPKLTATEIAGMVGTSPLMLEIGACDGEDTEKFLAAMPQARLVCFEPDPRPRGVLCERLAGSPQVTVVSKGVTDTDGVKPFWPSGGKAGHAEDWYYSGSFSEPTQHKVRSPEITFGEPQHMPSTRLDTWLDERDPKCELAAIDFVWADLQGGQVAFIAGARLALSITRYLYIECHTTPLYADEPTQEELVIMLRPEFEPLGIYEQDNILFRNKYL
jgi:FkbM family methyltransferase